MGIITQYWSNQVKTSDFQSEDVGSIPTYCINLNEHGGLV